MCNCVGLFLHMLLHAFNALFWLWVNKEKKQENVVEPKQLFNVRKQINSIEIN